MGKKNKKKEKEISKKNKVIGINQETCAEKLFLKKRKMKKKDKTVKDVQAKKTEYEEMVINTGKRKCSEMESLWKASTGDDIYQNQGQKKIKMSFDDMRKTILLTNSNRNNNTKVRDTDEEMKRFDAEENLTDSFVGVSKLQDKNDEVLKISKSTGSFLKQGKGKSPDIVTKRMNNYKDSYEYAESDGSKKKKGQMVKGKDQYRSDRRIFKVRGSRSDKKYDKFDTATEKVKEKNRKDEMDEDTCIKKKYFIDEESGYDKRTRKVQSQESEVKKNDISSRDSHRNIRNYHNRNIEHSEVDQIIGLHKMRPESDPGGMVKKNSESTQISTKKNESNRELNYCKSDETMSPRKSRSDSRLKCKEKKKTKKHREKHKKENTKLEEKQSKKEKYDKTKSRTEEKQETKSSKILEGESEGKVMSGKIKKEKNKKDQIEKSRRKMKMDRYDNSDKDDKYLVKSDKMCGDFNVVGMSSGGFKTKETDNNTECKGNKKLKSVIEITYEKDDGKYLKVETTQGKNNRKYKQEYNCNKEVKQMIKTGRNKIIESNDDDDDSSFYKIPKSFVIKQGNDVTLSAKDTGTTLHENNQMKKHYTNTADSDYKLKERENKWNVSEKQCSLHSDNKESIIVPKCESRKCAEKFADDTTYRDQQNHLKVKQHEENVDLHRNKTDVTMETDSLILGKPEDTSHFMMSGDDILLENYTKYDNKCTREVQMKEISIKKKGTTHVSVNDRAEIQNNDEVSQNVHSSKINEEKCKCEGERSAKSSGNYHECVKNDDIISFCDCGSIVHASEEFKTICLQRHKDVLNKVQDLCNDEKKENSVKNLKEILKESKNKESKNGQRKEGGGSVKENYFLQKDSCDSDLQTGGVENKSIDEKTKKVKSVISLVSIPATISSIQSSADDKIKADFEDKMSSRFCRSQSVRKIMHEELINMKRILDLGFENSREDKIKSNIEETVLKKHENVDFKSICEDLSNEEMDTGKKLDSKRRGNNSVKCDEHEHISEKISDIDGVHDVTIMKDESKLEHMKPKEGNSLFNIDIDNIIKRVSKKDDIFKTKKKQRKQNKNYERTSEPGSKTFQSLESSDESTSSAKEEIEGKRLESVEPSISRECKSSTIDSRDKYETDYTLNIGDEMMKSSTQLKEIEIRKSTKKRRKQRDCNEEKYHLEKKNRRKFNNVEKRRKTRSKSFDKNEGDEIASRDQYYKKRYSKDGEFSKNGDVSENMAKENKSNKFKLGGMYFDRMEECNQYDKRKSGSPMRVEGNKNTNALYTPDINKNMSIRSAQDGDNRENEFSIPVRNQHPSHSYLNRNVKHYYSSSMYPVYSDNHDRYPYSRANKIFDDQSSTSSSSNFNRSYDYSSPFMFDTKYFNSLNERSSNGGLNSTISSTPDRPRFRIPSYKELTGRENEVEEDYSNDKKEDFELFWRIQSPFSQFHPAKFEVHGVWYNCAEQFFMHQKALTFNDKEIAAAIMNTAVPREQKSLGRKIVNFCPKIWFAKAISVAKEGNIAKFSQNEHLKKQLFNTYPKILAEASPVDNTWGIGLAKDNQLAWSRKTWRGQNFLGYTLTDVRNELMRKEGLIPVEKGGTNSDEKEGANSDEKGGENS